MSPGAGFPGCELDDTVFWCVLAGPHLHISIKGCRPILAHGDGFFSNSAFLVLEISRAGATDEVRKQDHFSVPSIATLRVGVESRSEFGSTYIT